jgi:demethylmenaquinone methyltransferase/2-methoxy-6-polyprenyl-1,4-benzoquinol methylase
MQDINVKLMINKESTDFGFERIPPGEKTKRVNRVFSNVADRYDLMNDLMSLGIHRLWKRFAVSISGVNSGDLVLDIAGGTGDMVSLFHSRVGSRGYVIMSDINAEMLQQGRNKLIDKNIVTGVDFLQVNAEALPIMNNYFDCVNISFGLRNVTDKSRALTEMYRVTRYGGCLVILEFSRVIVPLLDKIYEQYSFKFIPWLGKLVAGDENSYQYLVESIRMHPDQESLKKMIEHAGFQNVSYHNLSGGIVAVHKGYKI